MAHIKFSAHGAVTGLDIPSYATTKRKESAIDGVVRSISRKNKITALRCKPDGHDARNGELISDRFIIAYPGRTIYVAIPR